MQKLYLLSLSSLFCFYLIINVIIIFIIIGVVVDKYYIRTSRQFTRQTIFLDSGHKSWTLTLDARLSTLDAGLWTLGSGLCTLDTGLWTLDAVFCKLDSGRWTLKTLGARIQTLGIGCWILDIKTLRSTVTPFQVNVLFLFNHLKTSKTRGFQRFSDDMESELQLEMN